MADRKPVAQQQYEAIMANLRAKRYSPVYILMGTKDGTESYYLDMISQYVLDNVLAEDEKDFNQTLFYGSDVSMRQVIEQAKHFPMMADHQVVVLREAQAAKEFDLIEKYIEKPNPATILVICYKGAIDGRKKYLTQAQKVGEVAAFAPLREWELAPFIEEYAKSRGASIDGKAASMIAEHVGSDMKRLVSEIEKVCVVFPPGAPKNITPALIEKCVGISKDYNVFELRDAISRHDVAKANIIVKHFMDNPRSGGLFSFLPIMFSYFQNLMLAHYAPAPRNASAIMTYLGLRNEYATKVFVEGMRHYNPMKTIQIIDKFREIDARSKGLDSTANTTPDELAKELIFFILH